MKKTLLIILCLATLNGFSQTTQPQFTSCSGAGFALINAQTPNPSPSTLYSVASDGSLTAIGATGQNILNGMGRDDRTGKKYIWALTGSSTFSMNSGASLFRIGADGTAQQWAAINPPTGGAVANFIMAFAGDMNPSTGDYYIPAMKVNSIFPTVTYTLMIGKFNVDNATFGGTVTPTYTAVTLDALAQSYFNNFVNAAILYNSNPTVYPEPSGLFQDFALSPDGSQLVSFFGIENALFTINLGTMSATTVAGPSSNVSNGYTGHTGATTDEIGGLFYDEAGTLYAVQPDRGRIFSVDPTTGALTLLPNTFASDLRGDATGCFTVTTTPVAFQSVDAAFVNNNLTVSWITATENNVDHFVVEASANGIDFREVKTMGSLTSNGNSAIPVNYNVSVPLASVLGILQIMFIPLLGFTIRGCRKANVAMVAVATIFLISIATACSKSDNPSVTLNQKVYIRVKEVAKDNSFTYSKIVTAVND